MEKRISIVQKCQYFYTLNENRTIYSCVLLTILCSIIIHLIACNYVLLCIILWAHASSLNLRDTSDRLTKYSQLKRAAFQLEPLIKSVFEVSKHWHLRTIGFKCCAYFQKNSVVCCPNRFRMFALPVIICTSGYIRVRDVGLLSEKNKR